VSFTFGFNSNSFDASAGFSGSSKAGFVLLAVAGTGCLVFKEKLKPDLGCVGGPTEDFEGG
jgi:hypothetical protein